VYLWFYRAFHRSKHLLEDLFGRASRGYE